MVRLTLNAGKHHGVLPADVAGTVAYHANSPKSTIGAINILDKHNLVDLTQQYVKQILAKSGKYRIHKDVVTMELS